jgi:hypothetical protein
MSVWTPEALETLSNDDEISSWTRSPPGRRRTGSALIVRLHDRAGEMPGQLLEALEHVVDRMAISMVSSTRPAGRASPVREITAGDLVGRSRIRRNCFVMPREKNDPMTSPRGSPWPLTPAAGRR